MEVEYQYSSISVSPLAVHTGMSDCECWLCCRGQTVYLGAALSSPLGPRGGLPCVNTILLTKQRIKPTQTANLAFLLLTCSLSHYLDSQSLSHPLSPSLFMNVINKNKHNSALLYKLLMFYLSWQCTLNILFSITIQFFL